MIRRPPRSTLFPTRRSSDLFINRFYRIGDLIVENRVHAYCNVIASDHGLRRELKKLLAEVDRKSTRLNSSHLVISYAVFCLKKKKSSSYTLWHRTRPTRLQY